VINGFALPDDTRLWNCIIVETKVLPLQMGFVERAFVIVAKLMCLLFNIMVFIDSNHSSEKLIDSGIEPYNAFK
jgi:hypothetical protein